MKFLTVSRDVELVNIASDDKLLRKTCVEDYRSRTTNERYLNIIDHHHLVRLENDWYMSPT